jgi:hypothetical protein
MELMGVGYALAAAALFGASTLAAKLVLRDLSRFMLSALLYLGAARRSDRPRKKPSLTLRAQQAYWSYQPQVTATVEGGCDANPFMALVALKRPRQIGNRIRFREKGVPNLHISG